MHIESQSGGEAARPKRSALALPDWFVSALKRQKAEAAVDTHHYERQASPTTLRELLIPRRQSVPIENGGISGDLSRSLPAYMEPSDNPQTQGIQPVHGIPRSATLPVCMPAYTIHSAPPLETPVEVQSYPVQSMPNVRRVSSMSSSTDPADFARKRADTAPAGNWNYVTASFFAPPFWASDNPIICFISIPKVTYSAAMPMGSGTLLLSTCNHISIPAFMHFTLYFPFYNLIFKRAVIFLLLLLFKLSSFDSLYLLFHAWYLCLCGRTCGLYLAILACP